MEQQQDKEDIYHSAEIPTLIFRKVKGFGDFKTEEIYIESKGHTIKEAKEGLNKLIKEFKKL